jgi:hypothetical protein
MHVGWCEAVVVGKGDASGDSLAHSFETGKKLLGAGDATESGDWAVDWGNVHPAVQPPDGAFPTPFAECGLKLRSFVWRGDGNYGGPAGSLARFAQIAGWKQTFTQPVAVIEQQNVHVAVELAVLKAVVENVNGRGVGPGDVQWCIGLGKLACS